MSSSIVRVRPFEPPLRGVVTLTAPTSKSHALRALILAGAGRQRTRLEGLPGNDDVRALAAALDVLAAGQGGVLEAGEGAAPARFLLALAAVTPGLWTIDGHAALRRRPMREALETATALGGEVAVSSGLPVVVRGAAKAPPRRLEIAANASSQHASAALLAAAWARMPLELGGRIAVSRGYLEMTAAMLRDFGHSVVGGIGADRSIDLRFEPKDSPPARYRVPVDASGAAFLWLAGALGPTQVRVLGIDPTIAQPDSAFLSALERLGAKVHREPAGAVVGGGLEGGIDVDLRDWPDAAPALAVAMAGAGGRSVVRGAAHLRSKESDRIAVLVENLRRLGCRAVEQADGFAIEGGIPRRPPVLIDPHGDHRVAMAFAALGVLGPIEIGSPECTTKSFPGFFEELARVAVVDVVG